MADIFISYKREEQPIARKLADALQMKGLSVWWDPKVRAGQRFDDVIDKALKESKCIVVLWSKLSVKSQNVKDEAAYALNRDKLVPVAIEEVDLPYRFERINTGQLIGWDGSDTFAEFQKLVDDIAKIIGAPPAENEKRKRKQEEERKRWEEKQRKTEEERQRLEEEIRRLAEEKRKFEEELQRRETAQKAEEKRKQKEVDEKRRAEEERKRQKTLKHEADMQRVKKEAGTTKRNEIFKTATVKTEVKRIESEEAEDELIFASPRRSPWLPILLTTLGWAIGWVIYFPRSMDLNSIDSMGLAFLGWIIGVLFTMIALRQELPSIQKRQVFFIIFGWGIGMVGNAFTLKAIGEVIDSWVIRAAIGGTIGGWVIVIVLRLVLIRIQWKQVLFVISGWAIGMTTGAIISIPTSVTIGESIGGWVISAAIGGAIEREVISAVIGGAICGFIGGTAMFVLIEKAKRDTWTL